MSEKQKTVREKQVDEFVKNLSQLDDGERARLKRNAGNSLAESHQVRLLFYQKVLPYGVKPWQEDPYFLLATLYPFDKLQRDKDRQPAKQEKEDADEANFTTTLGRSFRTARTDQNQPGLDRRFARLLDADEEQLPFQLRQAIMRLTADWIPINWPQLTADILAWTHPNRYVQRNWARDYVASKPENK